MDETLELKDLHIEYSYVRDPDTGKYSWQYITTVRVGDTRRSFQLQLQPDATKRILAPVVDVLAEAMDVELEQLKRDLMRTIGDAE